MATTPGSGLGDPKVHPLPLSGVAQRAQNCSSSVSIAGDLLGIQEPLGSVSSSPPTPAVSPQPPSHTCVSLSEVVSALRLCLVHLKALCYPCSFLGGFYRHILYSLSLTFSSLVSNLLLIPFCIFFISHTVAFISRNSTVVSSLSGLCCLARSGSFIHFLVVGLSEASVLWMWILCWIIVSLSHFLHDVLW